MYESTYYDYGTSAAAMPEIPGYLYFISFAVTILMLVAMIRVFQKAGHSGWATIVPIYNTIVLFHIAKMSGWYVLLLFIPIVNIVILILMYINIAKGFGKSAAFGIGLSFLSVIFMPILAFGDSEYNENLI